jgi:hypothetical protein
MRIIKKTGWVLLIVIVIAQFFGPEKNHGDINDLNAFFEDTNPPEAVTLILKESCFDCHSSFTRYPWYNNITPVNYWISSHIDHGRSHLNFSNWTGYNIKKKDHKLEELIEMVGEKEMPLPSYTWMHSQANLTDAQIRSVLGWAKLVRSGYSVESKPE